MSRGYKPRKYLSESEIDGAVAEYAAGRTAQQIGATLDVHKSTIIAALKRRHVAILPGRTGRPLSQESRDALSMKLTGRVFSPAWREKMSLAKRWKQLSLETRQKLSAALRGRPHTAEHNAKVADGQRGKPKRPESIAKSNAGNRGKKRSPEHIQRIRESVLGPLNVNWLGGRTVKARNGSKWRTWKKSVHARDGHKCVLCGAGPLKRSELHADHITPWALDESLRFDLSNGRTLCIPCHKKTATWGSRTTRLIKRQNAA